MADTTTQAPRKGSGVLRALLIALAAVAALLVVGVVALVVLVDSEAVASRVRDRVLPQVSERIGRDVTVGPIDVSILPIPTVRLDELRVEGVGEQPLVAAESARARLDVWTLITSLGKEIRLESIELRGAETNLVKLADGTWGFQEILDRLEQQRALEEPKQGAGRQVVIDRIRIEDGTVRVIDRSAPGGTAVAELQGIEATAKNVGPGEPMALDLRAALQSETPNLRAQLQVDPLPADFGALGPGTWPVVTGSLSVRDAPLGALRNLLPAGLDQVTTGGLVQLQGNVATEGEKYVATGTGELRELQLRGEPAQGGFGFTATVDPQTKALQLGLRDIEVKGPGIDLGGTASLRTGPTRFEFALAGPLLDLDTLMGVLPEKPETEKQPPEQGPIVPDSVRSGLAQAQGSGTLQIDRLVSGKLTATDVQAEATLQGGELKLEQAQAKFYGGTVKADGTSANLVAVVPTWELDAEMAGVQLQQAMEAISGSAPLAGTLDSDVNLVGAGVDWEALRDALTGAAALGMKDGRLATIDLEQAVSSSLVQGLRDLGQRVGQVPVDDVVGTTLRDLHTRVKVDDGWMVLQQPITVNTGFGKVQLDGRIGLDWALDLDGTAQLSPDFVAQLTGGSLRPSAPVAVPLQLGGTLRDPAVAGLDGEAVARSLLPTGQVERRVEKEVERGKEKARREAQKQVEDALRGRF
ncbi:AsmA family protein [Vulgatibacter sp.]|uniref:AsmA family protein n=1 Tax=Vulgatibacter sp. TaxID=1971226 RepID=UPI003567148B